jgi:hypothetical protein
MAPQPDLVTALAQRPVARKSLGLSPWQILICVVGGLIIGGTLVKQLGALAGQPTPAHHVVAWLIALVIAVAPTHLARRARRRWIERLELPLDRLSYLDALDGWSHRAALEVELHLPSDDRAPAPPDVASLPGTRVTTSPGRATITGPMLPIAWYRTFTLGRGRFVAHHNAPLHHWFRKLVDRALSAYEERAELERIVVRRLPEEGRVTTPIAPPVALGEPLRRRPAARRALGIGPWQALAALPVGGNLGLLVVLALGQLGSPLERMTNLGIVGLAVALSPILLHRLIVLRERRWLELLGLPLDRSAYLDALCDRSRRALVVEARLPDGPAAAADAPRFPGTQSEAAPGLLRFISPEGRSNRRLHRWFRDLAERVLHPLARTQIIDAITVRRHPPTGP